MLRHFELSDLGVGVREGNALFLCVEESFPERDQLKTLLVNWTPECSKNLIIDSNHSGTNVLRFDQTVCNIVANSSSRNVQILSSKLDCY